MSTYMSPEDPVQQAPSGWLWWLIPVQIGRSRPLRPKHIQISETLRFYHLNEKRGEEMRGEERGRKERREDLVSFGEFFQQLSKLH